MNRKCAVIFHLYLNFETYQQKTFWPIITMQFEVTQQDVNDNRHFHVPYLVSNYGLTTYRGSFKKSKL